MDDGDAVLPNAVADEHIGNRLGNGDDPVGTPPIRATAEMKVHPTSDYERRSSERRADPRQGQGVRIMSVEDR
jgi:hypothetical protein